MSEVIRARKAACLTLEQAARAAGISVGYLRQLESAGTAPYRISRRLARAYGVPISTFVRDRQRSRVSEPEGLGRLFGIGS